MEVKEWLEALKPQMVEALDRTTDDHYLTYSDGESGLRCACGWSHKPVGGYRPWPEAYKHLARTQFDAIVPILEVALEQTEHSCRGSYKLDCPLCVLREPVFRLITPKEVL